MSAAVEDEVADLALVGAVDHPAIGGDDRFNLRPQDVVRRLGPSGTVDERIELDELDAERLGQLSAERRLAVPTGARNHSDPAHHATYRILGQRARHPFSWTRRS